MAAWRLPCYVCGEGQPATSLRNVRELFSLPPKDVRQEPCPEANSPLLIRKVVSGATGNWPRQVRAAVGDPMQSPGNGPWRPLSSCISEVSTPVTIVPEVPGPGGGPGEVQRGQKAEP